jgi:hypothetical protein
MYPSNSQLFMKQFEDATQHPYGYMLVDLKPMTSTQDRLQPNAFTEKPINRVEASSIPQFDSSSQSEQTCEEELSEMSSCDDCGLIFQDTHDLQRHVKKWCPESQVSLPSKRQHGASIEDVSHNKISKLSEETHSDNDVRWETAGFDVVWQTVVNNERDDMKEKRQKYEKDGKPAAWIKQKMEKLWKADYIDKLVRVLTGCVYFMDSPLFRPLLNELKKADPDLYPNGSGIHRKLKLLWRPILRDILLYMDLDMVEDDSASDEDDSDEDDTEDGV